jgi:hypothetical protein
VQFYEPLDFFSAIVSDWIFGVFVSIASCPEALRHQHKNDLADVVAAPSLPAWISRGADISTGRRPDLHAKSPAQRVAVRNHAGRLFCKPSI